MTDFRYAVRVLVRRPGLTLATIAALALGIGATTVVYSLMRAVLLRPLPYHDPARLVHAFPQRAVAVNHQRHDVLTGTDVIEWQRRGTSFESIAVLDSWAANLAPRMDLLGPDGAERLRGAFVTPNLFELLGVSAALGRTFTSQDATGDGRLVVLSHGLWQRRFAGDPAVIGRSVDLISGRGKNRIAAAHTVIGILPAAFRFTYPAETEAWALMPWSRIRPGFAVEFELIARLKPGVSPGAAQSELTAIHQEVVRGSYGRPASELREHGARVETMAEHLAAESRPGVLLLAGAVMVVLLIGCVNVALLLLAAAVDRAREISIRLAVGATRARLVRQLMIEATLMSVAGATAGLMLAVLALPALRAVIPTLVPRGDEVRIDPAILGFVIGVTVVTALLCGMAPAWYAQRREIHGGLRSTGSFATGDRRIMFWRRAIVSAQVAVVFALLVTASLLVHSFWRLRQVDLGFSGAELITMEMRLLNPKYFQPGRMAEFQRALMERVPAVPGVQQASMTSSVPFRGTDFLSMVAPKGSRRRPGHRRPVDPDYFALMRIPIVAGRGFTTSDTADSAKVVIVSRKYAESVFGDASPLGRRLDFGQSEPEIIGVVGDVRHASVDRDPAPAIYLPRAQEPSELICLVVRAQPGMRNVGADVRAAVHALDPEQPVERVTTLGEIIEGNTADRRFFSVLTSGFASIALLLATVGLVGVVSRTVTERTREIAVRIALGAEPRDVIALTTGETMRPVALGLVFGLIAAWAGSRLLRGLLFEVTPLDPGTYAVALLVFGAVAALACYVPARRTARIEPMLALRAE